MNKRNRIIVAGGGAAGMVAAISARRLGAEVTILERNPRVGKKILATGNGRCNFTNINADINCYHGNNPRFAHEALELFSVADTIRFFEKLGIEHKVEDLGKVFPMSDQASSILDVLFYELNSLSVNIVNEALINDIVKKDDEFIVTLENGCLYRADRVIVACGGKAMPSSGSDGRGYDLAIRMGHSITDVFPALVQLKLEGKFFKRIAGVKLVGSAEIICGNKLVAQDRGDILFADYGVSGPPILQISRKAGELLKAGLRPQLKLNIMDTKSRDELLKLVRKRVQTNSEKAIDFGMVGMINKRLIPVILALAGVNDIKRHFGTLSDQEIERIVDILRDWRFEIRGTRSWPSAQITAGGIDTREIDPNTMESKIVKDLYFAGEIIDIDGMCGGFNLQWAWSSGFIAGRSAAL